MEGVAISYARIGDQLQSVAGQPQRILASGRVIQDLPAWLQILADALEATVIPVTIKRSKLRGTALIALYVPASGGVGTARSRLGESCDHHGDQLHGNNGKDDLVAVGEHCSTARTTVRPAPAATVINTSYFPGRSSDAAATHDRLYEPVGLVTARPVAQGNEMSRAHRRRCRG
jgi:hypothetical protein